MKTTPVCSYTFTNPQTHTQKTLRILMPDLSKVTLGGDAQLRAILNPLAILSMLLKLYIQTTHAAHN